MPFPTIVTRESTEIYKNDENIISATFKVSWTGDTPLFACSNKFDTGDPDKYQELELSTSGLAIAHTFTTTGQVLGWKVVFVRGYTEITRIEIERGAGMTGSALVTNDGMKILLERGLSASPTRTPPSQIKGSEDTTAPAITDTDLPDPVPLKGEEVVDEFEVTTGWTATGTNTIVVNTAIFQRGTAALSLVKSDVTTKALSMSKTVTSLNFTSKTAYGFFNASAAALLVLDATPATFNATVVIRYGSDSSNYYEKQVDFADIVEGRNVFFFSSATADATVGSPSLAAMDYLFCGYETTNNADVLADGDMVFDEVFIVSSDDYFKGQSAGYPKFNYTSFTGEVRARLTTTQAVGFLFSRFGHFNTDSPELQATSAIVDPISKSDTEEIILSEVFKYERGSV
jgi:hypothetical protein